MCSIKQDSRSFSASHSLSCFLLSSPTPSLCFELFIILTRNTHFGPVLKMFHSLIPVWIVTTSPCLFTRIPKYIVYHLVWACMNIFSSYWLIGISALLLNNCTRNSFAYNCLIHNKCAQSIYHFQASILIHKIQEQIFCILSAACCQAIT